MNKGGRPKVFKSVGEVKEKINNYFEYCETNDKPYTMSGLAFYLGISRQTLVNYSYEQEFFDTIKKARDKVQMQLEENLYRLGNNSGIIFNLKNNFGWKDKLEVEQETVNRINIINDLPQEEENDN